MDITFSSCISYKEKQPKNNLGEAELHALKFLGQNKDIVIQKPEKGNTVVIIDKNYNKNKMKNLISGSTQFKKLIIEENKQLNDCSWS